MEEWNRRSGGRRWECGSRGAVVALRIRSIRRAAELADVSESTWRHLESGKKIARGITYAPTPNADTKAAVTYVLGWTPDSIDRLLAGDDPVNLVMAHLPGAPEGMFSSVLDGLPSRQQPTRQIRHVKDQLLGDDEVSIGVTGRAESRLGDVTSHGEGTFTLPEWVMIAAGKLSELAPEDRAYIEGQIDALLNRQAESQE